MHCPNCGTQASADQKFCRSCGISLRVISEVLAEEVSAAKSDQRLVKVDESTYLRRKKLERWGKMIGLLGFSTLMLMIICAFIGLAVSKIFGFNFQVFFDTIFPVMAGIAIPLLLIGAGLAIYPHLAKELSGLHSPQPAALPQADTTNKLASAPYPEPAPSVAEPTTNLLGAAELKSQGHN